MLFFRFTSHSVSSNVALGQLIRRATQLSALLACLSFVPRVDGQTSGRPVPNDELSSSSIPSDSAQAEFMIRFRALAPMLRAPTVLAEARAADAAGKRKEAADKYAWAIVSTRTYKLRDSLDIRLRQLVSEGAWGKEAAKNPDVAITATLDTLFQQVYDRSIAVTPSPATSNTRLVLGEYVSGTQCGPCWQHDRAFSALLQRYRPTQFIAIAYHDGPGAPIAYPNDSLWKYVGESVLQRPAGDTTGQELYRMPPNNDSLRLWDDWIDGVPTNSLKNDYFETATDKYNRMVTAIDSQLRLPPGASLGMTLTPQRNAQGSLQSVEAKVKASVLKPRAKVGVRLVLVQDTVRVTGYTPRRLQYMAARAVAWFGTRRLFHAIPTTGDTATVTYKFDITKLQEQLTAAFKSADDDVLVNFPFQQDWLVDTHRLGVIAIVQDQNTREILQTLYMPVSLKP